VTAYAVGLALGVGLYYAIEALKAIKKWYAGGSDLLEPLKKHPDGSWR
jgi:hypothetical protein